MTEPATPASDQAIFRTDVAAAFLTLAILAILCLGEIGAIVGDVSAGGASHPASVLYSISGTRSLKAAMQEWSSASSCLGISIRSWLTALIATDVAFIIGYAGFLTAINRRWAGLKIGWYLLALVMADLAEDILSIVAIRWLPASGTTCAMPYQKPLLLDGITLFTVVKTMAIVALAARVAWVAVRVVWLDLTKEDQRQALLRVVKALGIQRFVLVIVVALGSLLLLQGPPILEQGVDVERSWVLDHHPARGALSAAAAVTLILMLTGALRYLASIRSAAVGEFSPPSAQGPATSYVSQVGQSLLMTWRWLVAAVVLAAFMLVMDRTGLAQVSWSSAVWAPIVLVALAVASAIVVKRPPIEVASDLDSHDLRKTSLRIGRSIAFCLPAILLLSVCRALVSPILVDQGYRSACITVFTLSAVVCMGYVLWAFRTHETDVLDLEQEGTRQNGKPGLASLDPQLVGRPKRGSADGAPGPFLSMLPSAAVSIVSGFFLIFFPTDSSDDLGAIGVLALGLLALTAFYASLQILAQQVKPLHLFAVIGLRRTPVIAILLIIGVLSTLFAGDDLHDIRRPSAQTVARDLRPTLPMAFRTWVSRQSDACSIPIGPALMSSPPTDQTAYVHPLVMVAAEGGAIRAAWWTVDAMSALTASLCGRQSVFLASGASGGAVGLGMMASNSDARAHMAGVAGEDATAVALDGFLSRDLLAGWFGINAKPLDGPASVEYPDRAALMEQTWDRQMPGLSAGFPGDGKGRVVPWETVFNSTSVTNKCRVLISSVRLTTATSCGAPGNPMPGTYDLFSAEPCYLGMSTSTASLLAGRFPYVTPSGVVTSCDSDRAFRDQLIDGGYSENTGLDTVNGALEQVMPLIRAHNVVAVRHARPLIVPLVVFLHNSFVPSTTPLEVPKPRAEPLIPPFNQSDYKILGSPATLLQRASTIASDWIPREVPADTRLTLEQEFRSVLETVTQTMTVAPEQSPTLALPLGWALSSGTEQAMDSAMESYLGCASQASHGSPSVDVANACPTSVTFDTLLDKFESTSP